MQAVLRVHDIVIGRPERALNRSGSPRDFEVSISGVESGNKQIQRGPAAICLGLRRQLSLATCILRGKN